MQIGLSLELDVDAIVNKVANTKEAKALPVGSIVGDLHGGLTFTDAVAAALERRSVSGWQEIHCSTGQTWTVIILNR